MKNNKPIDIIVSYLDEETPGWRDEFNKYKAEELKGTNQDPNNRQAFGAERYRDWENFRYWFRGVEKNCPWVNKVFLVVKDERHVPKWLDRNHPKLEIVTHEEFLPKDQLPTFNGLFIEMYYYNIEKLSNNFICCNDDFFFLNPIAEDTFFEGDVACQQIEKLPYKELPGANVWQDVLNNNLRFLRKHYMEPGKEFSLWHSHLPEARQKDFEAEIMAQYGDEITASFAKSHFRHKENYFPWLFIDIMRVTGRCINKRIFDNSLLVHFEKYKDLEFCKTLDMACFNDNQQLINFKYYKDMLLDLFEEMFPEKSSFELDEPAPRKKYNKKLEILVPQYKETFETVKNLLDSIEVQKDINFNDIGVIICNDGTDVLLDENEFKNYKFDIKYLKNKHTGVSGTRQYLFDNSDAEYVMFCDADDMFLRINSLAIYLSVLRKKNYTLVISNFESQILLPAGNEYSLHSKDGTFIHGKIFSTRFLKENNIKWNESLTLNEDSYFVSLCIKLSRPEDVFFLETPLYLWTKNPVSVSNTTSPMTMYINLIKSNRALIGEFLKRKRKNDAAYYYYTLICNAFYRLRDPNLGPEETKKFEETVKEFKVYLNNFSYLYNLTSDIEKEKILGAVNELFNNKNGGVTTKVISNFYNTHKK